MQTKDGRVAARGSTSYNLGSRTIDWWSVHLYVLPVLDEAGTWPIAGSPTWEELASDHPAKLAAVLDGGRRDALRNDTIGAALAAASRAISGAADWSCMSRTIRQRSGVYIPREVA
jgi:hypothetical protein